MRIDLEGAPPAPEWPDGIDAQPARARSRQGRLRRRSRPPSPITGTGRRRRSRSGAITMTRFRRVRPLALADRAGRRRDRRCLHLPLRAGRGGARLGAPARRAAAVAAPRARRWPFSSPSFGAVLGARRKRASGSASTARTRPAQSRLYERVGMHVAPPARHLREGAQMSRLRAKCPDCRTFTAVALGTDYQCHSCGREFRAGLVRVPRAWGLGGEAMAEAAQLPLPYPETAVIEEGSLAEQTFAIAAALPELPLVLGGCCCSHIGAIEGLAARHERLAVVWIDAHGDLNTPVSSPSGNAWGMPLRFLLEDGDDRAAGRRPHRRTQPRPARGRVPRRERRPARPGRCETGARGQRRASTSRSTATCSFPASCPSSCPSRTGPRSPRSSGCSPTCARTRRCSASASPGYTGDPGNVPALERFAAALGL